MSFSLLSKERMEGINGLSGSTCTTALIPIRFASGLIIHLTSEAKLPANKQKRQITFQFFSASLFLPAVLVAPRLGLRSNRNLIGLFRA